VISVTARQVDDLRIVVRNTGLPLGAAGSSGFGVGLENVRKRLRHHYGESATLVLERDETGATVAELCLPLEETDIDSVRRPAFARSSAS
jgi:LytS/YehU family sensor histidine kinase